MSDTSSDLIEVIDSLASAGVFEEACQICAGKNWYFGNRSNDEHAVPFWKMDLDGVPAFDAIWRAAQSRCEELAGRKLRVVRQYANGHTYGLGGQPHRDDDREGTFTLLFYPMPEWKPEWQGETVFHDEKTGEIDLSVMPRPNRAVFFDARIPHAGRAPSRSCPELRITVAFKLEPADKDEAPITVPSPVSIADVERDGTKRVYQIHAEAVHITTLVAARLQEMARTLRLPGFQPGKIPMNVLESRYGARTRTEVLGRLSLQAAERLFAGGGLPASLELVRGAESGDVEFRLTVTHLPDLPDAGAEQWDMERLTLSDAVRDNTGLSAADAAALLNQHLHLQVLDHLNDTYQFSVAAPLVERELEVIRQTVDAQPGNEDLLPELRAIAERRVRLGAVMVELARRHQLGANKADSNLEDRVVQWLISQARVTERPMTPEELQELAG